jgi:hypothetical protein
MVTPPRPQPYIPEPSKGPSKAMSPNTYQVPQNNQTTPKRPAEREVQVIFTYIVLKADFV